MLWPKKNSCKEFDNEKKFLRLKNSPPPPHNFSNGPSLTSVDIDYVIESAAYGVIFTSCLCYSFPSSPPFAKGEFGGGAAKKQPFECKR